MNIPKNNLDVVALRHLLDNRDDVEISLNADGSLTVDVGDADEKTYDEILSKLDRATVTQIRDELIEMTPAPAELDDDETPPMSPEEIRRMMKTKPVTANTVETSTAEAMTEQAVTDNDFVVARPLNTIRFEDEWTSPADSADGSFRPIKLPPVSADLLEILVSKEIINQTKIPSNPPPFLKESIRALAQQIIGDGNEKLDVWTDFGGQSEAAPGSPKRPKSNLDSIAELTKNVHDAINAAKSADERVLEILSGLLTSGAVGGLSIFVSSGLRVFINIGKIIRQNIEIAKTVMSRLHSANDPDGKQFSYEVIEKVSASERSTYYVMNVANNRRIIQNTWMVGYHKDSVGEILMSLRQSLEFHNFAQQTDRYSARRQRKTFTAPALMLPCQDYTDTITQFMAIMKANTLGRPLTDELLQEARSLLRGKSAKTAKKKVAKKGRHRRR